MIKINQVIVFCFLLILSIATYGYYQASHWQYQAEDYLQDVSFSLYQNRGFSSKETTDPLTTKIAKADQYYNQGKQLKALAHYEDLLVQDPANAELLLRVGVIYLQKEQYQLAQEYLEQVYAAKDAIFALDGAWFLGLLQSKFGNKEKASHWFREVVEGKGSYYSDAKNLLDAVR